MGMPLPLPSYTIEDLDRFPRDGNRYELLDGMLLVTPAPLPPHQVVIARLLASLHRYLEPAGLAHVVSPGAIEVAPKTHLEPDLLIFPSSLPLGGRWRDIGDWWLACEVFSDSSVLYDSEHKRPAYTALGVKEVWLVNWWDRYVDAFAPYREPARLREGLTWHPEEMPEPLTIDLNSIFRGLPLLGT